MLELASIVVLLSMGYLLGFFIGWTDGRKAPPRERVTTPASAHTQTPPLCQDYSHLKRSGITKNLSRASIAHMSNENIYEKVYDAETVEDNES
jgi:hypothetical protein